MSWDLYTYTNLALVGGLAAQSLVEGGYRPLQWAFQPIYLKTNIAGYFFDAVMREEHISQLRITEHPVQTGANISDHAFEMPSQLMLEIGMSDSMASFVPGQYLKNQSILGNLAKAILGGGPSKSVSAYQTLLDLQASRIPLQVTTRLRTYKNMLIEQIVSPVDAGTANGLRAIVILKQIISAQVATTTVESSDPQTTGETNKGAIQTEPPSGSAIYEMMENRL